MRAVYGIVAREFVRFWRQRGRVLASIGRPFVWLVFAGGGFAAVFAGRNEIDYRVYMAPGRLGMVVMFGSLLAALSTVTDREAGVLRMVLVAPIRRSTIAFGKALGATLLGTAQAIVVAAILLPFVHLRPTLAGALLGLVAVVLSGLAMGALGLVLAASIRSIENFAGVMNFVVFPMLFLSGALYPVRHLGPVLHVLAHVNPLAYGVDLLKHALLTRWADAGYGGELPIALDCVALAIFAVAGLAAAAPIHAPITSIATASAYTPIRLRTNSRTPAWTAAPSLIGTTPNVSALPRSPSNKRAPTVAATGPIAVMGITYRR